MHAPNSALTFRINAPKSLSSHACSQISHFMNASKPSHLSHACSKHYIIWFTDALINSKSTVGTFLWGAFWRMLQFCYQTVFTHAAWNGTAVPLASIALKRTHRPIRHRRIKPYVLEGFPRFGLHVRVDFGRRLGSFGTGHSPKGYNLLTANAQALSTRAHGSLLYRASRPRSAPAAGPWFLTRARRRWWDSRLTQRGALSLDTILQPTVSTAQDVILRARSALPHQNQDRAYARV